jgi:hypothetical protein
MWHLQNTAVMDAYFRMGRNSCETVDGYPVDYTHSLWRMPLTWSSAQRRGQNLFITQMFIL